MDLFSIILIAFGLSADAFAVSVSSGMTLKGVTIQDAVRIATFFGGFQAFMPAIGWLAGMGFRDAIATFDHWIAFGLLAFIGGKMIYEALHPDGDEDNVRDPRNLYTLLLLAIATSIDALAVGLGFSLLSISISLPVILIGVITFVMSFGGVFLGKKFGEWFSNQVEIIGGCILILIGTKILFEHL